MLATLQRPGIMPSFSRPTVSDDNPYSEALFRTLKYTPAYPKKTFASLDAAQQWVLRFVIWYNTRHRHSVIKFVTPVQRHYEHEAALMARRRTVYAVAKRAMSQRWKGLATRNWQPVAEVWLRTATQFFLQNITVKEWHSI